MNNAMMAAFGTGVNFTTPKDLYPDAGGASTAEIGGAATPYTTDAGAAGAADPSGASTAVPPGRTLFGQPLTWYVVLVAMFLVLGWAGHKLGGREGETGVHNLRLSGYNVLFIGLASLIFLTLAKVVFTKVRVPGLSTVVQAA